MTLCVFFVSGSACHSCSLFQGRNETGGCWPCCSYFHQACNCHQGNRRSYRIAVMFLPCLLFFGHSCVCSLSYCVYIVKWSSPSIKSFTTVWMKKLRYGMLFKISLAFPGIFCFNICLICCHVHLCSPCIILQSWLQIGNIRKVQIRSTTFLPIELWFLNRCCSGLNKSAIINLLIRSKPAPCVNCP